MLLIFWFTTVHVYCLQVRIDHRTKSLSFGTDLGLSQREEAAEGPTIQNMPSENIRNQLTNFGYLLAQAVAKIAPRKVVSMMCCCVKVRDTKMQSKT